ncbi:hypothetical protein [Bifidobacterium sp. SO1]|nr:hypothetical protein [Bifidobacterium sp. SO1]MBT1161775.1 hypothetical protein [Bifidobacterium sp. SO1]
MSRENDDRNRERFAEDTGKWSVWAALAAIGCFLLIPLWDLIGWLLS